MKTARPCVAALLLAASPGCKVAWDFTPASAVEVRSAMREVEKADHATIRDARGDSHRVDRDTEMLAHDEAGAIPADAAYVRDDKAKELSMGTLVHQCSLGSCWAEDARVTWEVGTPKKVADGSLVSSYIEGTLLVGALAGLNVACFGTDVCSNGSKTAVIVTDVVVGVTAAGLLVLWYAWKDFHGYD